MEKNTFKKISAVCYIMLIAAVCILPLVGAFFSWGSQSTENRTMMAMPQLLETTEDTAKLNLDYTEKLGDYFAERFGFRQELVTASAQLNETLFGRSANNKTTVGQSGWYFLNETLDDYTGASALSERGIYRLQKTLDLMNRYCEDGNVTMLFFSVPNKNSVYPEYMPWYIRRSRGQSNLDRLSAAMGERDYYLDIKNLLLSLKEYETRDIYLKHDSHWNNLAALTAYNAMQDNLARRVEGFDHRPVTPSDLTVTETQIAGDLTNTLYPSSPRTGLQYDLNIERKFAADRPLTDLMAEFSTTCQGRYYSEICYRDSFFNALIGINSNAFAKVRYTRAFPYDMTAARSGGYQIAVVEIAERNLPTVLGKAPVMGAAEVPLPARRGYVKADQHCTFTDSGDIFTLSGRVGDWASLGTDSNIYIELRGSEDKTFCYEAFPILDGDAYADDGFSARIEKYSLPNDTYHVYLHVGNDTQTKYTELHLS